MNVICRLFIIIPTVHEEKKQAFSNKDSHKNEFAVMV